MKRAISLLAILVIFSNHLFADVQPGYVRTIKRPGKKVEYISNAQISVKGIPGSFRSKSKGMFELELKPLKLKSGDPFTLNTIFKEGYELYDNNKVKVYSPAVPVEIILKNIAQEAKDQNEYAKKMFSGSEAKYKKRIENLEKLLADGAISESKYKEELQHYQDLFDKYQSQIDVIAKRYAGLDYADIDPTTEAINVAFTNGDFELADSLLNSLGAIDAKAKMNINDRKDIISKIEFGSKIFEEGNDELEQNKKDAEKLAELMYAKHLSFLNEFQNDSAAYYLKLRVDLVTDNTQYLTDYGEFITAFQANYSLALDCFKRALEFSKSKGDENMYAASCYNNIGIIYDNIGDYNNALINYKKAFEIWKSIYGENHLNISTAYNNIASINVKQANFSLALENLEKALSIRKFFLGEEHPDLASIYNNLGYIYTSQRDFKRATENFRHVLKIMIASKGENCPEVALMYNNLGVIYDRQNDFNNAEDCYTKALEIRLRVLGDHHPSIASSFNNIGYLYSEYGEYVKAKDYYEKSLKIRLDIFGEKHPDTATSYNNLAFVYSRMGDLERALEDYNRALNIWIGIWGENHSDVAQCYNNIGFTYDKMGNYLLALENYEKALSILLPLEMEDKSIVESIEENICATKEKLVEYTSK